MEKGKAKQLLDKMQVLIEDGQNVPFAAGKVLVNKEEFAEMKGSLEARKQRLVDRMNDNAKQKDQCFEHMHQVIAEKPELKDALLQLMNEYDISI